LFLQSLGYLLGRQGQGAAATKKEEKAAKEKVILNVFHTYCRQLKFDDAKVNRCNERNGTIVRMVPVVDELVTWMYERAKHPLESKVKFELKVFKFSALASAPRAGWAARRLQDFWVMLPFMHTFVHPMVFCTFCVESFFYLCS
jgi:hypothetical protein